MTAPFWKLSLPDKLRRIASDIEDLRDPIGVEDVREIANPDTLREIADEIPRSAKNTPKHS